MAAISRRDSEERQQAVLRFFIENPKATGEEAQKALTSGRLTGGKKQQPMGIGMLFRLKRKAEQAAAASTVQAAHMSARSPASAQLNDAQLSALRERARELQMMLAELPEGILEVHISREGSRVVRVEEDAL